MTPTSIMMLTGAWIYLLLPYTLASYVIFRHLAANSSRSERLILSLATATAAAAVIGTVLTRVQFVLFLRVHHAAAAGIACVFVLDLARRRPRTAAPLALRMPPAEWAIVLLAAIVRLASLLGPGVSLGGDDSRFHHLLSSLILKTGALPATWQPFANVPVDYPLGSHVLTAALATLSGRPVHDAFNILIVFAGAMTAAMIFVVARRLFANRAGALLASFVYAFLPFWGSLNYLQWGGLPNAIGMLFVCLLLWFLLPAAGRPPLPAWITLAAGVFCLASIVSVHHYTILAAGLLLISLAYSAPRGEDRAVVLFLLLLAMVAVGFPLLGGSSDEFPAGATALLRFRERPLDILDFIRGLNPALVVAAGAALWMARRAPWTNGQLAVKAWLGLLLLAFAFLEYGYRGASLWVTRGQDCFTALTPSRLITDAAYPLALLIGWLPGLASWPATRRRWISLLAAAAVVSVAVSVWTQRETGRNPAFLETGTWLREHTPPASMLVGSFPHMEYLAWRESNLPPLPASEARASQAVAWKRDMDTIPKWLLWHWTTRRPVYFIFPASTTPPPYLEIAFANDHVLVLSPPTP